jgi:hypothetical protein
MFFDGAGSPSNGRLEPDLSRPGLGLEFKFDDAEKYRSGVTFADSFENQIK